MLAVLPGVAARFPPRPADQKHVCRAIELRIDATEEPIPAKQGKRVVTELAFGVGNEGLEAVVEREASRIRLRSRITGSNGQSVRIASSQGSILASRRDASVA